MKKRKPMIKENKQREIINCKIKKEKLKILKRNNLL